MLKDLYVTDNLSLLDALLLELYDARIKQPHMPTAPGSDICTNETVHGMNHDLDRSELTTIDQN